MTLTPLQASIARQLAAGLPMPEIARRRGCALGTVHVLSRRIRAKLGAQTPREIAAVLPLAEVRDWNGGGRPSSEGWRVGDPVRVMGGRFAGRDGEYVSTANSRQIRVRIGGGVFALARHHVVLRFVREAA